MKLFVYLLLFTSIKAFAGQSSAAGGTIAFTEQRSSEGGTNEIKLTKTEIIIVFTQKDITYILNNTEKHSNNDNNILKPTNKRDFRYLN